MIITNFFQKDAIKFIICAFILTDLRNSSTTKNKLNGVLENEDFNINPYGSIIRS